MPDSFMFLVGTLEERAWMDQGACKGMDPEVFHPEEEDPNYELLVTVAKDVCEDCPVIEDCLDWAMTRKEKFGIWGKKTALERHRIRRRGKRK